jgi:hypothetical protein
MPTILVRIGDGAARGLAYRDADDLRRAFVELGGSGALVGAGDGYVTVEAVGEYKGGPLQVLGDQALRRRRGRSLAARATAAGLLFLLCAAGAAAAAAHGGLRGAGGAGLALVAAAATCWALTAGRDWSDVTGGLHPAQVLPPLALAVGCVGALATGSPRRWALATLVPECCHPATGCSAECGCRAGLWPALPWYLDHTACATALCGAAGGRAWRAGLALAGAAAVAQWRPGEGGGALRAAAAACTAWQLTAAAEQWVAAQCMAELGTAPL